MDALRRFYRTAAFRYLFWGLMVVLLVTANWALKGGHHLLLLVVAMVGVAVAATGIGIERANFRRGESLEPAYTSRVIRQVALLAISLGFVVMSLVLMTGILD